MAAYIVALTGASGALYGVRLISELMKRGDDCEVIVSPSGFLLLKEELGIEPEKALQSIKASALKGAGKKKLNGSLKLLPHDDLCASAASGSALKKTMIICPCSMGTLARIAAGISGNLIERAADCVMKERGTLVLVPRETPLSSIHLENMLKLSRAGAVILPAMPAFYQKPVTIDDMADFIVGKILDVLGIENSLYKRWKK
ncbi:MAG: aromatic acid decarboxylase [Deltaproteobacteria bacterium GWC2_56_8]|nr:MAG: aromatic acid decarboxylase [Deltaproteobacteria bacterium GWB2_55_19]OGP34175.1 MAG: aromatic acid decarboxylase [Deltaproteobacteria bacterium GWC2_56_8]